MLKIYQQTIKNKVTFEGIGLHTGKESKIKIIPGTEDQGIIFKRIDLEKDNIVVANYNNVSSAILCTTLQNKKGVKVSTVEHLLAALYVAEIDNVTVEINCDEVPIMDGSAKEFVDGIKKAGLKKLSKKRKYLKILNKVELIDGKRKIFIEPNTTSSFEVNFQLNYKNKIIGNQKNLVNFQTDQLDHICQSRTFCLFEDIEKIKKNGLAKGGSLDNAVVVGDDKILNKDGLRNKNEFVNHKILDLAGDFMLSGYRVLGKLSCFHGGHELTNTFIKKLTSSEKSFSITELKDIIISENIASNQTIRLVASA